MVMGGDSCAEGCGFESQHCILDELFVTYICCKNCNVCLKRCQEWPLKKEWLQPETMQLVYPVVVGKDFQS